MPVRPPAPAAPTRATEHSPWASWRLYPARAAALAVHHVGHVLVVFSTKERPQPGQAVAVQAGYPHPDRQRLTAAMVEDGTGEEGEFFRRVRGVSRAASWGSVTTYGDVAVPLGRGVQ